MALSITTELSVAVPPERLFAAMTDVHSMKHWMKGFVRMELLTPGPFGLGAEFRETRKMLGHEATEQFEVTAFDPPRQFGLRVDGTKGSMKKGEFLFVYDFVPEGSGTKLTARGEIRVPGFFMNLLGKLFGKMVKKACDKDLFALKAWVESGNAKP